LQPLEGITVASPAVNLLGPLAASRPAEFGASVPKVEPPACDPPLHASLGRCLNTPLRAPARPSDTGYEGDAGMSGGAFPGCGIHESADGHVALSAVEPHFFERALWALGVDGCRDAIRGAFAGKTACELEAIAAQADIPRTVRSRGGRRRLRGVRRGSSLRRTTIHFAEETGRLYLPTGNPLPSGQSTIALFGSPRKGDWFRRKQQCARQ
jgi:hypothetical protein